MVYCDACRCDFPDWQSIYQHRDELGHWVCDKCDDWFDTEDDLEEHMEDEHVDSSPQWECEACDATFPSPQEARYHMNALYHWRTYWCSVCEKGFQNASNMEIHLLFQAHRDKSKPFKCESCPARFASIQQAIDHMQAIDHLRKYWCLVCKREIQNENNLEIHLLSKAHKDKREPFKCEVCPARFASLQQASDHMEAMEHWRINYCYGCARGFKNENNLRMHLRSKVHKGSNMICPFCSRSFTTATGLTHHIEIGSCRIAWDLNRDTLFENIRRRDPDHVITKKFITNGSSPPITTIVSPDCWNGRGYECYICHGVFYTLKRLEQHVNSPVHMQKVYHCWGRGCFREFTTLAGLFNHLESESCGAMRFEAVQRNMGDFIMGRKTIALG